MKKFLKKITRFIDLLLLPFVYPSAGLLKIIRIAGVKSLPLCKNALIQMGVFPVRNHYYEPQFDFRNIKRPFSDERFLTGIEWNISEQIHLLDQLIYADELVNTPTGNIKDNNLQFHFNNGYFESGDAEYWYQIIRAKKPGRIFEIGSGYSTLMAIKAIQKNRGASPGYTCNHVCIEPFEARWLEKTSVSLIRKKIEEVEISFFSELEENDILFIDSSHIIRPEGDVTYIFLQLLPSLNKGVIVHVHDIFSPRNYLSEWLNEDVLFWNEQYLLEAFLTGNNAWKIIGSLNYLHHNYYEELKKVCPYLNPDREPGSFYIQKSI